VRPHCIGCSSTCVPTNDVQDILHHRRGAVCGCRGQGHARSPRIRDWVINLGVGNERARGSFSSDHIDLSFEYSRTGGRYDACRHRRASRPRVVGYGGTLFGTLGLHLRSRADEQERCHHQSKCSFHFSSLTTVICKSRAAQIGGIPLIAKCAMSGAPTNPPPPAFTADKSARCCRRSPRTECQSSLRRSNTTHSCRRQNRERRRPAASRPASSICSSTP